MKTNKLNEILKKYLYGKNRTRIICTIGIVGILLIFLSEIISSDKPESETQQTVQSSDFSDDKTESYKQQIKNELKSVLSKIKGVGDCDVMLTLEGTTEYIYAENIDKSTDSNNTGNKDDYKNEIVIIDKDGNDTALVRKIVKPKISGVVIVCEGGGNLSVNERVIKAASTVLDLPSGKICVESKK